MLEVHFDDPQYVPKARVGEHNRIYDSRRAKVALEFVEENVINALSLDQRPPNHWSDRILSHGNLRLQLANAVAGTVALRSESANTVIRVHGAQVSIPDAVLTQTVLSTFLAINFKLFARKLDGKPVASFKMLASSF